MVQRDVKKIKNSFIKSQMYRSRKPKQIRNLYPQDHPKQNREKGRTGFLRGTC